MTLYRCFLFISLTAVGDVESFTASPCWPYQYLKATSRSKLPTKQFEKSSGDADFEDDSSSLAKKTELWLDLRGTAILPTAAIEFLRDNLSRDDESLEIGIDRILVASNKVQTYKEISDEDFVQPDLLYVSSDDYNTLYSTEDGVAESFGEIILMERSAGVANPLEAIQTLSSGKWVVLEHSGDESEAEDSIVDKIGDFLEIASNSVSSSWTVSPGTGLLVHQSPEMGKETTGAGVAIQCSSPSSVMQLASTIEFAGSGMSTTMLDSGILIQEDKTDTSGLPLALLLPFDIPIWRVANNLYGEGIS